MKINTFYFLFCLSILFTTCAFGQYTEVINSNRPGVSKSAFAVGANVLQFEFGPYFIKEKRTPATSYEVSGIGADFAIRYGLFFEQLEVNLEGTYQNDKQTFFSTVNLENDRSNFKSFTLGAKYLVYDPYKNAEDEKPNLYSYHANQGFKWKFLIPAVSVYAGINIDSKNNPYVAPDVEGISPKIMVATQHNFTGGWVFVMNLLKDRIGSEFSDFQYILTLTKSVADQWAVFGEAQGIKSDFYADNLFRIGGAYLWSKDFQLDTAVTFNTKDTPSVFSVNLGASYRLDFHQDTEDNNNSAEDEARRKARKRGNKRNKKNDGLIDDSGN